MGEELVSRIETLATLGEAISRLHEARRTLDSAGVKAIKGLRHIDSDISNIQARLRGAIRELGLDITKR